MSRTPHEVFDRHQEALETGNFELLMEDYADDAVLLTLDGAHVGKEAIGRDFFGRLMTEFPDVKIAFERTAVEGDLMLLQWSAEGSTVSMPRGVAVFLIRDGKIQRQGEWFQMIPK
jgi:ketosteroid isomerase-like protein